MVTGAGDWDTANNWQGGKPGINDTAQFALSAAAPRLQTPVLINALTVWAKQGQGAPWSTHLNLNANNLTVSELTQVFSVAEAGGAPVAGSASDAVVTFQTQAGQHATYQTKFLDVGYYGFTNANSVHQNRSFVTVGPGTPLNVTELTRLGGGAAGRMIVEGAGTYTTKRLDIGGASSTSAGQAGYHTGLTVTGLGTQATVTGTADQSSLTVGHQNGSNAERLYQGNPRLSFLTIDQHGKLTVNAGHISVGTYFRGEVNVASNGELKTVNGRLLIGAFKASSLKVDGAKLTIGGALDISRGTGTFEPGSTVTANQLVVGGAAETATLTASGAAGSLTTVTVNGPTTVSNNGTLQVNTNAKVTSVGAQLGRLDIALGGTVVLNGGKFEAEGGATNNGTLRMRNESDLKGKLVNNGTLKIAGLDGVGTGTAAVVGDFTQSPTGEVYVHLSGNVRGTSYDTLAVSTGENPPEPEGNVTLDGHLFVTASYPPAVWKPASGPGDYFVVVSATGTLSGQFDPATGLHLPDPNSLGLPPPPPGRSMPGG